MSFYEPQGWQAPQRQASWEQPAPPSRSGASSTSQPQEPNAFVIQFEEVDRAIDNLVKSGKFYPRREPTPMMYGMHGGGGGGRMHPGRHSVGDAPHSPRPYGNRQNFYAQQRYQGRAAETDQMMQAKRRMAAQRERELRNYHQEQQYNRSLLAEMASNKSDRSMSPSTLSEEGRRELIARQHRALYGPESSSFSPQGAFQHEGTQQGQSGADSNNNSSAVRGASPRGIDPFGISGQGESAQQAPAETKTTSPSGNQHGKTSTPPSGEESSHSRSISKSTTAPAAGMGPIGSRPAAAQHAPGQPLNKRTTSPLPASLGYGFTANDQGNERTNSSGSGPGQKENNQSAMGPWGTGSSVWGSNKIGASVWS